MIEINKQAENLNNILLRNNPVIFDLLSKKGRRIFFPKQGIMAQSMEAKGTKLNATIGISLSDDGGPMRLSSICENVSLEHEEIFPYATSYGKNELRQKWRELIYEKNPSLKSEISIPVVSSALTHGLSMIAYLFLDEGEEIILCDRFWGNYKLIFQNGYDVAINTYNTYKDNKLDTESLDKKLSEKTGKKNIVFNFPNNPTGYTITNEEANKIKEIVLKYANQGDQILIVCDDAYFGLVYKDGVYKESLFSIFSDLHENVLAVKIDGVTKEDFAWGLRVGFVTYGSKGLTKESMQVLEEKTTGAIRGSISNVSNLSQSLILRAILSSSYKKEKEKNFKILKSRFLKVEEVIKKNKYKNFFIACPFNSGYFMCIQLNENMDGEKVRKQLLKEYDTGIIAMGNLLRIAYSALSKDDIEVLFENIYKCCLNSD